MNEQGSPDIKEQFRMKLADLDSRLTASDPNMGALLFDIHKQLMSLPELAYMLSEEEIGMIVEGNKRTMKIEIAAASAGKKTSVKKDLASMSADDF